ncbi:restriction endonuclease subunit S [Waltera sp.]|uniref:restriction endonuclease subunit S n=1 Tax=Waltera sp. TaxID=2815806 RepID=UPI003AB16602
MRFPGFDEPWKAIHLSDVGEASSGFGFPDAYQGEETSEIPFYKVSDMNLPKNTKIMQQSNNYVSQSTAKKLRVRPFSENAIVFAKVGAAISHERKRIALSPFLIDNNMMAFTPKQKEDLEFIYHLFQKIKLSKYSQVGALPSYNASDILDIRTFYPTSGNERKKIVTILNLVDNRIGKQSEIITNLKKYKRGLLSDLFGEKLTQEWTTSRHYFSEIAQRRGEKYDPSSGIEYPCVELENIEQETGKILATVPSIEQGSIKNMAKSGDTLFGKLRPYLRKYAFAQQTMVCSSEIWALIPSDVVLPKFLFYLVQTEQFLRVANISSGTKMPRAEWSNIEKAEFHIPDLPVQRKVVSLLEGMDRRIAFADSMLICLNRLKASLLQQLFI